MYVRAAAVYTEQQSTCLLNTGPDEVPLSWHVNPVRTVFVVTLLALIAKSLLCVQRKGCAELGHGSHAPASAPAARGHTVLASSSQQSAAREGVVQPPPTRASPE